MNALPSKPFVTATLAIVVLVASPVTAQNAQNKGAISVAQVMQMLDQAPTNRIAEQVLTAYLSGVGETAGVVVSIGGVSCQELLDLSAHDVRRALASASQGGDGAAATPLIVRDMLARAGCRAP